VGTIKNLINQLAVGGTSWSPHGVTRSKRSSIPAIGRLRILSSATTVPDTNGTVASLVALMGAQSDL
jgi:hypothetical protein